MRPNRQGDTDRASGSSDWNFFDDDDKLSLIMMVKMILMVMAITIVRMKTVDGDNTRVCSTTFAWVSLHT